MSETVYEFAPILGNEVCAHTNLYELELFAPVCAVRVCPGQFVHLELPGLEAHLLRRPLSVYQRNVKKGSITLLYQLVGEGTTHLHTLGTGSNVSIIGPVGRGWQAHTAAHALLVGGGVGAAPLYLLAEERAAAGLATTVLLGASTAALLTTKAAFTALLGSNAVHIATDDGSAGHKGFVTEPARALLAGGGFDYLACCGPEPMQRALVGLAQAAGVACQVSLERRMACGIGACLSCVVDTADSKKRACVDGPVFDAQELVW